MRINHSSRSMMAFAVLAIAAASGLGETQARAQLFANPYRVKVKVKERAYYPAAVVVSPYVPTTYVQTSPVVVARTRVARPAPVVERRVVQPAPLVETRLIQPAPLVERRIIQPAPIIERRVVQPAPLIERRMIISNDPF